MRKLAALVVALAALTSCEVTVVEDVGYFGISWNVWYGGQEVSCDVVGADTVSVVATDSFGDEWGDSYPCSDFAGTLGPLYLDDYTLVISILDGSGIVLGQSDPVLDYLDVPEETVPIGPVDFDFGGAVYSVTFDVDYGDIGGSNCDSGGEGDSGISQQYVALTDDSEAECFSYTYAGTDQYGDAFAGETCGDPIVCMENTVAQTIEGLPDGSYVIAVEGIKSNGATCFTGAVAFDVSGSDQDLGTVSGSFVDIADCNLKPEGGR